MATDEMIKAGADAFIANGWSLDLNVSRTTIEGFVEDILNAAAQEARPETGGTLRSPAPAAGSPASALSTT